MHHFPAPGDIDPELDQLVPVPTVGLLGYYQNRLQHSLAALDPTDLADAIRCSQSYLLKMKLAVLR